VSDTILVFKLNTLLFHQYSHIKDLSFTSGLGDFSGRDETEPEFTRVFGSVLDPKADRNRWHCHQCQEVFVKVLRDLVSCPRRCFTDRRGQDDTIYPHPKAKEDPRQYERIFFCRSCYGENFSKGNWYEPVLLCPCERSVLTRRYLKCGVQETRIGGDRPERSNKHSEARLPGLASRRSVSCGVRRASDLIATTL
jgi:hypothetical protein